MAPRTADEGCAHVQERPELSGRQDWVGWRERKQTFVGPHLGLL